MIRAVIDTNVLVSAMISSDGNEALVVLAINQGLVVPCFSSEILDEYREVLVRPKFGFAEPEVDSLIRMLLAHGERVDSPVITQLSTDPDDNKFLACAMGARADYLVTGNKRHFPEMPAETGLQTPLNC